MLKTAAVLFSFAAVAFAQESKPAETKKLASVTWDLDSHKLIWVVQKGTEHDGKFEVNKEDRYEIAPDNAVMSYLQEKEDLRRTRRLPCITSWMSSAYTARKVPPGGTMARACRWIPPANPSDRLRARKTGQFH